MLGVEADEHLERISTQFRGEVIELAVFFWLFRQAGALAGSTAAGLALGGQGVPPLLRSSGHTGRNGGEPTKTSLCCGGGGAVSILKWRPDQELVVCKSLCVNCECIISHPSNNIIAILNE